MNTDASSGREEALVVTDLAARLRMLRDLLSHEQPEWTAICDAWLEALTDAGDLTPVVDGMSDAVRCETQIRCASL